MNNAELPTDPSPARADARVAILLLAAGSSDRMGANKMLFELGAETVLRRAARAASGAEPDLLLVVIGHERERAEAELEGIGCRSVFNPDYAGGVHTSLSAGVENLPDDIDAAVVMLADMPHVTTPMLRQVIDAYRGGDVPLVVSCYGGTVDAPPVLYDRSLFDECRAAGRECGREIIHRHRGEAVILDWPIAALADLDTPEDYKRAREALGDDAP